MSISIQDLETKDYIETWNAMRNYTNQRTNVSPDAIWLLEHPPVFTQGQTGKDHHILNPHHNIPIIKSDRGGQVTYHGPGQLIAYILLDLRRKKLNVRQVVDLLENTIITLLQELHIDAHNKQEAPGVYINNAKICSLGLRVKHGCTYHGLALNVDMDLEPFSWINPCGYKDLQMTQIKNYIPGVMLDNVKYLLMKHLLLHLGYE